MAALKDTFVLLRLFNTASPRILLFGSQKGAPPFIFVRTLVTETQKPLETEQSSQGTKLVEQLELQPELSSKARAKVGEFLERNTECRIQTHWKAYYIHITLHILGLPIQSIHLLQVNIYSREEKLIVV